MKILVFSEEYVKTTKGMFVVWMNYICEASKSHQIEMLLNNEHWAFDETVSNTQTNNKISIRRLPFVMPSTFIKRTTSAMNNIWIFRVLRDIFGQLINVISSPFVIMYIVSLLRKIKPDAVISHNGGWPAGRLCRWIMISSYIASVPRRILVIHNFPVKTAKLLLPLRLFQSWIMNLCTTSIVTVSDSVKNILESEIFHSTVNRIHNGISKDAELNKNLLNQDKLSWIPAGPAIGFVGGLYPLKGPDILLDAFQLVNLPSELALIGPAEKNYLVMLKRRADLCKNKVSFLGFQQDINGFMQKIDFLVVPSIRFESFGMVILEAMRNKKAVICSDFGGMKEIVVDGVTGLIVSAGDKHALANAITILLEDADMRNKMGLAGYERFCNMFTSERMSEQYEQLLI
jgi:teichuronic acid biosynthesis glycosyltransferase TuaC